MRAIALGLLIIAALGVFAAWNILPEPPRVQVVAFTPEQIAHQLQIESAVQQARQVYLRNHVTTEYTQETAEVAIRHHVSPVVVAAVVVYESHANPNLCGRDCGLMQVNTKVWHYSRKTLLNPQRNLDIGASILASYVRRFGLIDGLHHYNGLGSRDCPTDRMAYAGVVLRIAGKRS
jgi:soluble lytic murein transglycosylase-like protein